MRVHYEITPPFSGIEAGAVWEDFRVCIGHFSRWARLALVTDVDSLRQAVNAFRVVMPGKLRVFRLAESEEARR